MVQSRRLVSIVSATMVTTLSWVTLPYSVSTYAQETSATESANSETVAQTAIDTSADPKLAKTLNDPNIAVEDLALLTKPLTLTQLRHEAAGWFLLLQAKVQKVSEEEVIIRREKRAIDAREIALEEIEAAETELEQVEAASADADPDRPNDQAFLQTVIDARTALREAEIAVETALRAEEKITAESSFQSALAQAQQEQSIIRIQEVLQAAQAFVAKLPADSSGTSSTSESPSTDSPAVPSEGASGSKTPSTPTTPSSSKSPSTEKAPSVSAPPVSDNPSIPEQVEQLGDVVSSFQVLEKRLKQIPPSSPDYAAIRERIQQAQAKSRTLALALVEQIPELADDVAIAEIEIADPSTDEDSFGLVEAVKAMLQDTNNTLEQIDAQLSEKRLDATTAQAAQQQLEASRQALQKTVQQEADLKNQIVVDATLFRSEQIAIVDRLEAILDEVDAKGGDSSTYRQYIQAVSRIEIDITDTASLGIRLRSWLQSDEGGARWQSNLLKFMSIALAFTLLSYLLSLIIKLILKHFTDTSSALQDLAIMTVRRGGVVAGILIALTALEVSLTPLLAVLGGASFVLAFALQSNLSNIASGLMMMWHKPFDVDDHVRVAGIVGFVKEVNLINTVIRSVERDTYVMPNELVWSSVIMNSTTEGRIRRNILVQVGFDVDIQQVESLLLEIAASHPKVLKDPKPSTQVRFAESYVMIRLRPWLMPQDYDRLPTDLNRMITERFQQEGIAIAIPAQSVHYSPGNTTEPIPFAKDPQ